jgi:universal stress protein A
MKTYRNILCATDFSSFSDQACAYATKLAKESGAKLTLFHVVDHFPVDRSNLEIAPEDVDPRAFRERRAREELEAQTARTACPEARAEVAFGSDTAAHEIVRYAGTNKVDLIVLGTHGYKGITELLGSTARAVRQGADCAVVVVPSEEVRVRLEANDTRPTALRGVL